MKNVKKTARSVLWSGVEVGGVAGLQFVTLIIMARLLSPADFGVVALCYSVIMIQVILVTGLFNEAIIQRRELSRAHLDSAFWTVLGICIVMIAGSWASASYLAEAFKEPVLEPVFSWMSISLLAQGVSTVHIAKFRRDLNFKAIALRTVIGDLMGSLVGIAMALNGFGVWSFVGMRLVSATVATSLVWISSPYRPGFSLAWTALWDLLRFGLPALGTQLVETGRQRLLPVLIGYFLGVTALGFIDIAYRITMNIRRMLAGALYGVFLPLLSRHQDNRAHLKRSVIRATEFTCLLVQPMFAGLAACAEEVVILMLGAQWLPTVPLVQILCGVAMLESARQAFGTAIIALGKPQIALMMMATSLALSILAVLVFGRHDMVAAIFAWNAQILVTAPLSFFLVRRFVGLKFGEQAAAFIGPLAIAALMGMGLFAMKNGWISGLDAISTLLIIVPLGALFYAGAIMLLQPKLIPEFFQFLLGAFRRNDSVAAE